MKPKAFVAEFIGTFALVWVGIYAIHNFAGVPGGLLGVALAHGLTIGVLASATMAVSGGHLNPAVTIAMLMARRISTMNALGYVVCQLGGAAAAAYVMRFVTFYDAAGDKVFSFTTVTAGTPTLSATLLPDSIEINKYVVMGALTLEAIATFFLVFAIFGTAVDKRAAKMSGLYIGLAVTIGILAIGPMTGAALNPARWFGPVMFGDVPAIPLGQGAMIYVAGPILGALVAALVYQFVLMDRDQIPGLEEPPAE